MGLVLHGWFFESQSEPETARSFTFTATAATSQILAGWANDLQNKDSTFCFSTIEAMVQVTAVASPEAGLYADGDAAVAFVINQKDARPERIVLYGQSLGTAVVADVASRRKIWRCGSRVWIQFCEFCWRIPLCRGCRGSFTFLARIVSNQLASCATSKRPF